MSGCNRFLFRGAVGHDTRHVHNLGNPTPVGLKFGFDFVHNMRHVCVLARGHFWGIKVWLDFPNISRRIGNSPACLAVLSSSWRPIMLRTPFRPIVSVLTAALLLTPSSFAFDSPLSDQAVREAYFLGQRHDASFLSKYIKSLPTPRTGPHISSVTFLTPFAQLAQLSERRIGNYSAQQARLDHRGRVEVVRIVIEIQLTPTYGTFLAPEANSRSSAPLALIPRPRDFWRDFQVQISDDDQRLTPADSHGRANYNCGRYGYPCNLAGATLEFDFPANAFTSESATIQVLPPEGDEVFVDFDLTRLR